jgi:hypothetical protein
VPERLTRHDEDVRPSFASLGVGLALTVAACASAPSRPLTGQGQLLWSFEGLLTQTFGSKPVSATAGPDFSCSGDCSPLATYLPYSFVFARHGDSTFHLSTRRVSPNTSFGNYPTPVLINGRVIACDNKESTFLIEYRDAANFAFGCLSPAAVLASCAARPDRVDLGRLPIGP